MGLVWRVADSDACAACRALDGKPAGDGWNAALGPEVNRYVKTVAGGWKRLGPRGSVGRPPLHPNCRCRVEEVELPL